MAFTPGSPINNVASVARSKPFSHRLLHPVAMHAALRESVQVDIKQVKCLGTSTALGAISLVGESEFVNIEVRYTNKIYEFDISMPVCRQM